MQYDIIIKRKKERKKERKRKEKLIWGLVVMIVIGFWSEKL